MDSATAIPTLPAIDLSRSPKNEDGTRPLGRPSNSDGAFPGINRTRLAAACGVDIGHMCKILNGKAGTSLPLAQKMAKAIGVGMDRLMEELGRVGAGRKKRTYAAKPSGKQGGKRKPSIMSPVTRAKINKHKGRKGVRGAKRGNK